jgi:hypothetical protein
VGAGCAARATGLVIPDGAVPAGALIDGPQATGG